MRKIYLILLILFPFLWGSESENSGQNLYIDYNKVPDRVYVGQVFYIEYKTTVVSENYDKLFYKFSGGNGVEKLSKDKEPKREIVDEDGVISVYDRFYFVAKDTKITTPRLYASIKYKEGNATLRSEASLNGKKITAMTLPETAQFSNILAKNLDIYKTLANKFDEENNILTIYIKAEETILKNIKFDEPYIKKQGIEGIVKDSFQLSDLSYYIVVPRHYDNFTFKYFNTETFQFSKIDIPIDVRDDMVSTAKDLRPKRLDHIAKIKLGIAIGVAVFFIILFYFYQHFFNLLISIVGVGFSIDMLMPKPSVCVNNGSVVRILPMTSSTAFRQVEEKQIFDKIYEKNGFIKIRFTEEEESEGWVSNEDICKN